MNIKIETWSDYKHEYIQKSYGSVLSKFGLAEANDGTAYITINHLEELFELDKELDKSCDEQDDWNAYFGVIITHDSEGPLLEIKDNYD